MPGGYKYLLRRYDWIPRGGRSRLGHGTGGRCWNHGGAPKNRRSLVWSVWVCVHVSQCLGVNAPNVASLLLRLRFGMSGGVFAGFAPVRLQYHALFAHQVS